MTEQHSHDAERRTSGALTPRNVIIAVLVVLAIVFIVENHNSVHIRLIAPSVSMPLWLALLAMFVIGGLAGLLVSRRRRP
ncbi:MAG: hypothetical protein ACR2F6_13315 [Mycobacteriales bacterium]